jgi:hypothetical protein
LLASGVVLTGSPQEIRLNAALTTGDQLCIEDTIKASDDSNANGDSKASADPVYSAVAMVKNPGSSNAPAIREPLSSDSRSVVVTGASKGSVTVYQFDSTPADVKCDSGIEAGKGKHLLIAANGTSSPTDSATLQDGPGPYTITLVDPPAAGSQICLLQTVDPIKVSGVPTPLYSLAPKIVVDANNPYPRIRTFYTAGFMINNQNGSNSDHGSSTGAEYLDPGLSFTPVLETGSRGSLVGVNTFLSGRFSAIPVAAPPTSSTTSTNTSTTSSDNGTLNILSSQSSFRMLGGVSFPVRDGVFRCKDSNCFFSGLVLKAGLDTLLNPSATATSGTGGSATTAVASFAPVYSEYSGGLQMGYKKYPNQNDSNSTPRTITQLDITLGKYSNLQSLVCNPDVKIGTSPTEPTSTPCSLPTPGATTYNLYEQSRKTLARIEVNGFFVLPSSPLVLGFDANLPQSSLSPRHLGLLNNPGGNVAVYFGVSGSLTSLFKGIKVANFN